MASRSHAIMKSVKFPLIWLTILMSWLGWAPKVLVCQAIRGAIWGDTESRNVDISFRFAVTVPLKSVNIPPPLGLWSTLGSDFVANLYALSHAPCIHHMISMWCHLIIELVKRFLIMQKWSCTDTRGRKYSWCKLTVVQLMGYAKPAQIQGPSLPHYSSSTSALYVSSRW